VVHRRRQRPLDWIFVKPPEEKKHQLERIAMIVAAAVIGGSIWYWTGQIQNVLEILEMAYG